MSDVSGVPLHEIHVPTGPPPEDAAASSAEIRAIFLRMWADEVPEDLDFVQEGRGLGRCLRESRLRFPRSVLRTARIREVLFLNGDSAVVRFTVEMPTHPRSRSSSTEFSFEGRAVRQDGIWLIERATLCNLVLRAGIQCPPVTAR
jgi:hypothetical protein